MTFEKLIFSLARVRAAIAPNVTRLVRVVRPCDQVAPKAAPSAFAPVSPNMVTSRRSRGRAAAITAQFVAAIRRRAE